MKENFFTKIVEDVTKSIFSAELINIFEPFSERTSKTICSNCGNVVKDGCNFCPNCGKAFSMFGLEIIKNRIKLDYRLKLNQHFGKSGKEWF